MKSFYSKIYKNFKHHQRLTSLHYGKDDNEYFLVSYPKSGNTWLRFLLANTLVPNDEKITLLNIGEYVPDIHVPAQWKTITNHQSLFNSLAYKFVKTHDPFSLYYRNKKVIYLVRDGRDVLTSYYHYLVTRKNGVSLSGLIEGDNTFGDWGGHVMSWENGKCKEKILIHYEDLLADPVHELERLCDFLEWQPNHDVILRAVEKSSFQHLRSLEEKYGGLHSVTQSGGRKSAFFRKGETGDWKNLFSSKDLDTFWNRYGNVMAGLGYRK